MPPAIPVRYNGRTMHRLLFHPAAALAAVLILPSLSAADIVLHGTTIAAGSTGTVTWSWQSRSRASRVHVPAGYSGAGPVPLVVVIHGGGGTSSAIETSSRWSTLSDTVGCLVAYPQGLSLDASGVDDPAGELAYWANDRGTRPDQFGIDDVGMIAGLVDDIAGAAELDADRVYAMGMSNGGMMVHRLGRDSARYWAGLCAVSGSYTATPSVTPFAPSSPVSMLIMHGTSDTIVPYDGGAVSGQGGAVIGAEASRDLWLGADGITAAAVVTDLPDTVSDGCTSRRFDQSGGEADTRVALIRIDGGNHSWPGGSGATGAGAGSKTDDFLATDTAWTFFAALHRQGEAALARGGPIAAGGSEAISGLVVGSPAELVYTLSNRGGGQLGVSGLAITSSIGCSVEILAAPATSIAAGGSGEARLRVVPSATDWNFSAAFSNDDADESDYAWSASGTASDASGGGSDGGSSSSGGGGGCGAGAAGGLLLALLLGLLRPVQPLSASASRRPISR
jgi:polyhydroxybutyrate depolymerase